MQMMPGMAFSIEFFFWLTFETSFVHGLYTVFIHAIKLLFVLLVSFSQIPVLPVLALTIAQWDGGHEILIVEKSGVVTLTLHHEQAPYSHSTALDFLIQATGHGDNNPDHIMRFSQCNLPSEEFRGHTVGDVSACCVAILQQLVFDVRVASHVIDCFVINFDRYHRISAIPCGLRQTVLLV